MKRAQAEQLTEAALKTLEVKAGPSISPKEALLKIVELFNKVDKKDLTPLEKQVLSIVKSVNIYLTTEQQTLPAEQARSLPKSGRFFVRCPIVR